MSHLVGIDVGGTFTDFVAFDPSSSELTVWKTLSTPLDPIEGILKGLEASNTSQSGSSLSSSTH